MVIKVIGIGSSYGADSIAWQVIDSLKHDHALQTLCGDRVSIINCDRPGASLVDYMQGANYVILVDALAGGKPGTLRDLDKKQLLDLLSDQAVQQGSALSSHEFGVSDALRLAGQLGVLPDQLNLIAIEIGDPAANYQFNASDVHGINKCIVHHINAYCQT